MPHDNIRKLLEKYLADTCSEEENILVNAWFEQINRKNDEFQAMQPDEQKRYLADLYKDILQTADAEGPGREAGEGAVVRPLRSPRRHKFLLIAASIAVLIMSAWFYTSRMLYKDPAPSAQVVQLSSAGQVMQYTLPDGTTVWLNKASALSYGKDFNTRRRDVFLDGEAFFEVTKNEKSPFIIHTGEIETRVLGTSFAIQAYSARKTVEVTVATGKVALHIPVPGAAAINMPLIRNQRVTYTKGTGHLDKRGVSEAMNFAAWKEGRLAFKYTPVPEVLSVLKRTFGFSFTVVNKQLNNCKITGDFNVHESPALIIEAICTSIDADYTIRGKQVTINGAGCQNE